MTVRQTLRVARWEATRSLGRVDRRTAVVLVVAIGLVAVGGVTLGDRVVAPDHGIYRVSVSETSPYYPVVTSATRFRAVPVKSGSLATGKAELAIRDGTIRHANSRIGVAALSAFRDAVAAYNDRQLSDEPDQAAAFPIRVQLRYRDRDIAQDGAPSPEPPGPTPDNDTGTNGTARDRTGGDAGLGGLFDRIRTTGQALFGAPQQGTPADITPPFPMRALLIAFAFLVPLNPLAQAYGSSVMGERIQRRGESLLVTPLAKRTIVAGKTIPYVSLGIALTAGIAFLLGGSMLTVVAVVPIVAVFLGATLLAGLFARSFTELSFLTLAISIVVTTYAFVPAIFTTVNPIAGVSPLSIVVRDLTGESVTLGRLVFATTPLAVTAIVLFGAGVNIYREEDLFTQRSPGAKALDAVAARLTLGRTPIWAMLTLPFVFIAELFAITILFIAPPTLAIPALFALIAVIEEIAKSLPARAGFMRSRFSDRFGTALIVGVGTGFGFAVGEKAFLAAQLVGLPELQLGRLAFPGVTAISPVLAGVVIVLPVAMHVVTGSISAIGARSSRWGYLAGLTVAVGLHLIYNLAVVSLLV